MITKIQAFKHKSLKILKKNKTLLENFSALSALQGLNMVLPLITLPYVLKVIGTDKYGIIILSNSLLVYFQSFTDYSFNITATRDVAVHRHSTLSLNFICNRVLSTKLFLTAFSVIVFVSLVFIIPQFEKNKEIFLFTLPALLGYTLFPEWFFQGIEKMKYITIISSVIKVFFTICVFVFIKEAEDFYLYPLFNGLGLIVAGLYAQYLLFKNYDIKFRWMGFKRINKTLKLNFNIFINQFLPNLYNNSTTFLLGIFVSSSVVGLYGASKNIVEVANRFIAIISRVFFPHLNRNFGSFNKFKKLILTVSFLFFIIIAVFSGVITRFFYIKGEQAVLTLCILALSIPLSAMYSCYGTNYFIVKRKDSLVMRNTIVASIMGFILAFPLIIAFSSIGAAINLTFARGIMGIGLWIKYKKHENRDTSSLR